MFIRFVQHVLQNVVCVGATSLRVTVRPIDSDQVCRNREKRRAGGGGREWRRRGEEEAGREDEGEAPPPTGVEKK